MTGAYSPLYFLEGVFEVGNRVLGKLCRKFRLEVLEMTLKDVQGSLEGIKTLSAFEHGRSTNYEHIFKYINACETEEQVLLFMDTLHFVARNFF